MPTASPIPPAPDDAMLPARLDALAVAGRRRLQHWRWRLALREAARPALWGLPVFPLAFLLARLAGTPLPGPGLLAGLSLFGPLLYVGGRVAWSVLRYRPARATALALHDANGQTQNRLVTADEFLATADRTRTGLAGGFMAAAVLDAGPCARQALAIPLPPLPVPKWRIARASWWGVPAALAVILLTQVPLAPAGASGPGGGERSVAVAARPVEEPNETGRRPRSRPEPPPPAEPDPATMEPASTASAPKPRPTRPEEVKEGPPGGGSGTQVGASNASTRSAGLAYGQRNDPKAPPAEPPPTQPQEDEEAAVEKKTRPPKQERSEAATEADSGQGRSAAAGSSASPVESPPHPDKAGLGRLPDADDEGLEDEDEEEKSNSANKPMLATKDPPVDRNLSGSAPPDDAGQPGNGRGGPGEVKKTRGVPSMILGVPVPDRVPGTPGPGRSKVTQEFSRPQAESHPTLAAESRPVRTAPFGLIEQPDLPPWRRALIENYFLSLRETPPAPTAPSTQP